MASARARRAIVNSLKNLSADINDVLDNFEESKVRELTGMKSILHDKVCGNVRGDINHYRR